MEPLTDKADMIWQTLHSASISYEQSMDALHRKQMGCYFTDLDLAYGMMTELVNSFPPSAQHVLFSKTFLEPCVGAGYFVFAYLRVC